MLSSISHLYSFNNFLIILSYIRLGFPVDSLASCVFVSERCGCQSEVSLRVPICQFQNIFLITVELYEVALLHSAVILITDFLITLFQLQSFTASNGVGMLSRSDLLVPRHPLNLWC
jgi:hypothetical protein